MSTLVTLADFKAYLKYDKTDQDATLQQLLDAVEEHLADLTDQTFGASSTVTQEVHTGDGERELILRRPASAITSIEISTTSDPASIDDTIPTTDVRIDPVRPQRLVRHQNGVFPRGLYNLFVTYAAADNLPGFAVVAVMEAAALLHRIRGVEHTRSSSLGELGSEVMVIDDSAIRRLWSLPMWRAAVEQLGKPRLLLA